MDVKDVIGTINAPIELRGFLSDPTGVGGLNFFLTNVLILIYTVSGIAVLFMIVYAAFQWITAGGDKEAVAKARARITNAIIGLVILSLAFVLTNTIGKFLGFRFFGEGPSQQQIQNGQNRQACESLAYQGYTWNGTECVAPNSGVPDQQLRDACLSKGPGFEWNGRTCVGT
jgi:hypothetical protein